MPMYVCVRIQLHSITIGPNGDRICTVRLHPCTVRLHPALVRAAVMLVVPYPDPSILFMVDWVSDMRLCSGV